MPEEIINPDVNKEVLGGFLIGLLVMVGLVFQIFGFMLIFFSRLIGNLLWFIGTVLIVITIILNIRSKHGKGFRIANIVIKIIVVVIITIMVIIANLSRANINQHW